MRGCRAEGLVLRMRTADYVYNLRENGREGRVESKARGVRWSLGCGVGLNRRLHILKE